MSALRYILASWWHYRRTHAAVAAGVAIATAVIAGALLVGDSVRGSLRALTLERLGSVEAVVTGQFPFRAALAEEMANHYRQSSEAGVSTLAPALLTPGSLSTTGRESSAHATQLTIWGVDEQFWKLGPGGPAERLPPDSVAISQAIAEELHSRVGDELLLRVGVRSTVPADSTLGNKDNARATRRVTVAAILNTGIARFSLQSSQQEPRNVFLPLATLQRLLDIPGKANLIAIGRANRGTPEAAGALATQALRRALQPKLADLGIRVEAFAVGNEPQRFAQVSSERLVIAPQLVATVNQQFASVSVQPVITYLANTIVLGDRQVPYSTVTGVTSTEKLGPLRDASGQPLHLHDDEIVLNDWTAGQLGAQVGDHVTLTYSQPETTHGTLVEQRSEPLSVRAVVPLATSDGQPTAAADPHLTPELPGVTDERSISDWDLPFELVEPISPADEEYWEAHRTTPKAFIPFSLAKRLWSTRWGTVSALRIALSDGLTLEKVTERLTAAIDPGKLGLHLVPIKAKALAASQGTTPFEGLFLGFSFFLMASAVMLITLLFRLGAENRAAEVGLLLATGHAVRQVRRWWMAEATLVAIVGAAVGTVLAIAYARLMIHGLTTWWLAATVTPFLALHVTGTSLATGFAIGLAVSLLAIVRSLRRLVRLPARQLLAGDASPVDGTIAPTSKWFARVLPWSLLILAAFIAGGALLGNLGDEAQAGAFFGSGTLTLAALITLLHTKLRQRDTRLPGQLSLALLALRNTRRYPSRTILAISLTAVASFLIVALSAFRLAPTTAGTGGFDLLATSDLPIFSDLNTRSGRSQLGFSDADQAALDGLQVAALRVHDGQDASCLNLYQTTQPRVLGIPDSFRQERQFGWAGTNRQNGDASPWSVLNQTLGDDSHDGEIIPVVLDKSTAIYSLHLSGIGDQFTLRDALDQPATAQVVGLLSGSILQGNVLMSERRFLELFPETAGQRLFLIRAPSAQQARQLAPLLESHLDAYGFDAVDARRRLAQFLAVQNTYLSTFQSLGALGLLLGTCGLAVAQLRSTIERRAELALLRSAGFSHARLTKLLFRENLLLLLGGLGCGCLAALCATLPHWLLSQISVPWLTLAVLLALVTLAGMAAGWLATRVALRTPLLPALRGD